MPEEIHQPATEMRRLNRNKMYRFILESEKPVTKQQIADSLDFSLPTIHQNIVELQNAGLILASKIPSKKGGRPATGYTANSNHKYAIGISVSYSSIRFLATDLRQNEIGYKHLLRHYSGVYLSREIATELEIFIDENQLNPEKILGVGITIPGALDKERSQVLLSPTLSSKEFDLASIREYIHYPVYLENDANAAGAAEWLSLPVKERGKDFVYLYIDSGVGGALFIGGKPNLGNDDRSGEFGHVTLNPEGPICACGKKGCFEAYCSTLRLTTDLNTTLPDFFQSLKMGNTKYKEIWEKYLFYLAVGINNIRMVFNCDILLGGPITRYLSDYMDQLKQLLKARNTFGESAEYIRIGHYPDLASMRGIAWHFTESYINRI